MTFKKALEERLIAILYLLHSVATSVVIGYISDIGVFAEGKKVTPFIWTCLFSALIYLVIFLFDIHIYRNTIDENFQSILKSALDKIRDDILELKGWKKKKKLRFTLYAPNEDETQLIGIARIHDEVKNSKITSWEISKFHTDHCKGIAGEVWEAEKIKLMHRDLPTRDEAIRAISDSNNPNLGKYLKALNMDLEGLKVRINKTKKESSFSFPQGICGLPFNKGNKCFVVVIDSSEGFNGKEKFEDIRKKHEDVMSRLIEVYLANKD